ncbi:hypothetical protein AZF04_08690 [Alkalihalobacillus trypoxylicola]|uniref:Uncharacterized protein n=1 Tax=Alkalihalobacillus trypoxylicola TaxID=519424 RepID=A0A161PJT5_9BACI|nr:hypothetical protein AZF04_08690 [Alkalihalobacillus trypoxylicola]
MSENDVPKNYYVKKYWKSYSLMALFILSLFIFNQIYLDSRTFGAVVIILIILLPYLFIAYVLLIKEKRSK